MEARTGASMQRQMPAMRARQTLSSLYLLAAFLPLLPVFLHCATTCIFLLLCCLLRSILLGRERRFTRRTRKRRGNVSSRRRHTPLLASDIC